MKTKKYLVEVTRTSVVEVIIPETLDTEDVISEWEEFLWDLENGVDSIATYAAECAVDDDGMDHDGVGVLVRGNPNYNRDKYQIVARVVDDDTEVDIIRSGIWE